MLTTAWRAPDHKVTSKNRLTDFAFPRASWLPRLVYTIQRQGDLILTNFFNTSLVQTEYLCVDGKVVFFFLNGNSPLTAVIREGNLY